MKLKNLISSLSLAGMAATLTSCFQVTQNLALNPDGSGKIVYNMSMPDMGAMLGGALGGALGDAGAEAPDPEKTANEALKGVITGSQGIDVWEKASAKVGEDGKVHIEASAYFKDVTKLKIGNSDGPAGGMSGEMTFAKDSDGNLVLEMKMGDEDKAAGGAEDGPKEDEKLAPEKLKAEIAQQRQQWQQAKPMMAGMMADMKMEVNVKMPGEIVEVKNFKKSAADTASFGFNGAKMVETMDKMIMDDKMAEKMAGMGMLGDGAPKMSEEMTGMLFGEPGGIKVVSKEGKPIFDYDAHVAKAKAGQSAQLKALLGGSAE
jgi:hypothetical protein